MIRVYHAAGNVIETHDHNLCMGTEQVRKVCAGWKGSFENAAAESQTLVTALKFLYKRAKL